MTYVDKYYDNAIIIKHLLKRKYHYKMDMNIFAYIYKMETEMLYSIL